MHTDARTLDDGTVIEGDVCIVGAGAAGMSMALDWVGAGHKVILLEGGGFDFDGETQALYRGENIGLKYYVLEATRLHFFGGTTNHWAGFCSTFDPIDFKKRDWVPHSGWPIQREDLDPFYARAQHVLELGPYEYTVDYWEGENPDRVRFPLDGEKVWTKIWQFSPPTRFRTKYRDALVNAEHVHLYTYANVVNIAANKPVSNVAHLDIKCLNGKAHTVRARQYVLACGAVQNARMLLASNQQAPQGLGNDHDLVGRYFMEHPEVRSAILQLRSSEQVDLYNWNFRETPYRGEMAITEDQQRQHQILNCTASLWPGAMKDRPATIDTFPTDGEGSLAWMARLEEASKNRDPSQQDRPLDTEYVLMSRLEQAPNPDSRILLSDEKDQLGVPQVKVDWQLTELDKRSIRKTYEILGEEMGRSGLGRVQLYDWLLTDDPMWPPILGGGWHHMGTTRMAKNPRQGVVDANCKVHGLGNLYVAGSAAFTTAGSANPTLTICALSLRLSDHLKAQMG